MHRALLLLIAISSLLGFSAESATAQVLVYKVKFSDAKGINFHTFDGGLVVAPLLGGQVSFLLTSTADGKHYFEASGVGTFFTAVSGGGDQKAVLATTTGAETAAGAIVAMGDINHVIKVDSRTLTLAAKVAKSLNGAFVSADDESSATATGADGSIGSAGVADVKLSLDEDETSRINRDGLAMDAAVEQLKLELEREGFSPSSTGEEPAPTAE